jgi:hypothetical protein
MTTSEISERWNELGLEPQGNRIYLLLDNVPKKSGLIHLVAEQATPSRIGTILNVGPDVKGLVPGDRILIGCHSGTNLYLWQYGMTNENWKMCTQSEVMAKITKESVTTEDA